VLAAAGIKRLFDVIVDGNEAARRLYRRLGYDEMTRIVAMGKEL